MEAAAQAAVDVASAGQSFRFATAKCTSNLVPRGKDHKAGGGLLRHIAVRGRRLRCDKTGLRCGTRDGEDITQADATGELSPLHGEAPGLLLLQHALAEDNEAKDGGVIGIRWGFSVDVWQSRFLDNRAWYLDGAGQGKGGVAYAAGRRTMTESGVVLTRGKFTVANSSWPATTRRRCSRAPSPARAVSGASAGSLYEPVTVASPDASCACRAKHHRRRRRRRRRRR